MSKISVALCTYNGEKYLAEQFESIFAQTILPDELIINDDFSGDKTCEIINKFSRVAPFPILLEINKKNSGSTKNFERAISRCTGDIIFLCDQDDIWHPEKVERIMKIFESHEKVRMVFSNAELIDENGNPKGKKLWDFSFPKHLRQNKNLFETLLRKNVVTGATAAFSSVWREKILPIPTDIPNFIHDAWIALLIAANAEIEFIDEDLIKYREHSEQQLGISRRGETRKQIYENSIEFSLGEIARVDKLRRVLPERAGFEKISKNYLETVSDETVKELNEQIEHYRARKDLPSVNVKRILPILREMKSGRYKRFSKGWLSAAKDLTERF